MCVYYCFMLKNYKFASRLNKLFNQFFFENNKFKKSSKLSNISKLLLLYKKKLYKRYFLAK